MADQDQLDRLKDKGVEVWNSWRKDDRGIQVNLEDANLTGANLTKANLRGAGGLTEEQLAFACIKEGGDHRPTLPAGFNVELGPCPEDAD